LEHGGNEDAALAAIDPEYRPWQPTAPSRPRSSEAERLADAARKRDERAKASMAKAERIASLRAAIEARAAQDDALPERAQVVLAALLVISRGGEYARPSVAALAAFTANLTTDGQPFSERTVQRAINDLEATGYIASERNDGRGKQTAIRRFVMPQTVESGVTAQTAVQPAESAACHPNTCINSIKPYNTVRGAEAPSMAEPEPASPTAGTVDRVALLAAVRRLAAQVGGSALLANYAGMPLGALAKAHAELAAALPTDRPAQPAATQPGTASPTAAEHAPLPAALGQPTGNTDTETAPLTGPDGAIAYPDGAAWLPTDAARAWWEALPRRAQQRPAQPAEESAQVDQVLLLAGPEPTRPAASTKPTKAAKPGQRRKPPRWRQPAEYLADAYKLDGRAARAEREGNKAQAAALRKLAQDARNRYTDAVR
jgi:hypothetical protein